ncbi:hypothetical protein HQ520_05085 [bacterium]|nr:hypothetical protein [bacterium]
MAKFHPLNNFLFHRDLSAQVGEKDGACPHGSLPVLIDKRGDGALTRQAV